MESISLEHQWKAASPAHRAFRSVAHTCSLSPAEIPSEALIAAAPKV